MILKSSGWFDIIKEQMFVKNGGDTYGCSWVQKTDYWHSAKCRRWKNLKKDLYVRQIFCFLKDRTGFGLSYCVKCVSVSLSKVWIMLLFAGFNFPYAKTNPVTAFVTMSFSSFRRRAMYFITSSSSGTSINILPSPVRSQVSFTLNSLHIKEITASIGSFLPLSYVAIVLRFMPILFANSCWVSSNSRLNFLIRSFK